MAAEAKHQATEILGRSYPMLLPAALFVMQQVQGSPHCTSMQIVF